MGGGPPCSERSEVMFGFNRTFMGDGRWAAMVDHRARSPLCLKFWLSNFTCQLTSGASFTMHTPEALNQVQL